jgi:hypothetical protein
MGAGQTWHKACFRCKECGKGVDATTLCENKEREIFCNTCHSKLYGPKVRYKGGGGKKEIALRVVCEAIETNLHQIFFYMWLGIWIWSVR